MFARRIAPAAVTAVAIALLTFGSIAASNVIGVVSSQGRYPEAMLDYVLPAFGFVAERWSLPIAVFGVFVFGGLLVLFRVRPRTAAVVLGAIAISAVAVLGIALVFAMQTAVDTSEFGSKRMLAQAAIASVGSLGTVFLTGTPMVVVGALLLRSWRTSRGLTEPPDSL